MTKTPSVADLMEALTTKPAPALVQIYKPSLKSASELIKYWLTVGVLLQFRTLVVWGFLATFFPALGITWFMVMFGLWAIRHVAPPRQRDIIEQITNSRK